jgi:MATE family multidrug resistance protein
MALGIGVMAGAAIVMIAAPRAIVGIYLEADTAVNAQTVAIAVRLLLIAAFFQVFDGAQAIAAGALRGYRDTTVPMVIAAFGYWGVGFVGGWVFAFPLGYGAAGMWWGLAAGLAVVAILLGVRLLTRSAIEIPVARPPVARALPG